MKNVVLYIAQSLVDYPEHVRVNEREESHQRVVELIVHPDDMGKVIGKQGRIAKAIRTVVAAAASRDPKRVEVDIFADETLERKIPRGE